MRFISGFTAVIVAGALLLVPVAASAQGAGAGGGGGGGGFGGGGGALPGYGANAYAPGQGPTGVNGWNGGNWRGYTNAYGLWGGWGGGGYYSGGGGGGVAVGGQTNVTTYNHFDNRRRDGGFYGGGGVFYGDDGYSRLYSNKPPGDDSAPVKGQTGYAPGGVYRPSQHIIYLPDNNSRRPRNRARHQARF